MLTTKTWIGCCLAISMTVSASFPCDAEAQERKSDAPRQLSLDEFRPKFVKRYAELGQAARAALRAYCADVRGGTFPGPEHGFK